jgi:hypothetical protein
MENNREMEKILQSGESWEERETELINEIIRRVDQVKELKGTMEALSEEENPERVESELNETLTKIRLAYSPDKLEKVGIMKGHKSYFDNLRAKIGSVPEDSEEYLRLKSEIDVALSEAKELYHDNDAVFLILVENFVNNMINKNKKIETYKHDIELVYADLASVFKIKVGDLKKRLGTGESFGSPKINLKTFDVNINIGYSAADRLPGFENANGIHVKGTPFSLIKGFNGEDVEKTTRHENLHNLLDEIPGLDYEKPYETFRYYLKVLNSKKTEPEVKESIKKEILDTSPAYFVNALHNEMLAEVTSFEEGRFAKQPLFGKVYGSAESWDDFTKAVASFSTAGNDAKAIVDLFKNEAKRTKDPELKEFFSGFEPKFKQLFLRSVNCIRDCLKRASEIDSEAIDDAIILFHVLPPTRYHHWKRYFDIKYDNK